MKAIRALIVFGTRPEAIKLAPVVRECRNRSAEVQTTICSTGQHREMLRQVTDYFEIQPDIDLELMQPGQSLAEFSARALVRLHETLAQHKPDCIVLQGDTTTVLAGALAAFYQRVPIVHVEAGLRTGNLDAPWPEEMNRRVASLVAALHCAPTRQAADNLIREGVPSSRVHVTGNTVIDALLWTVERERRNSAGHERRFDFLRRQDQHETKTNMPSPNLSRRERNLPTGNSNLSGYRSDSPRVVLITGHRRESFGAGFQNICQAIAELAAKHGDVEFVYPVHLNPQVREPVERFLAGCANVHLLPPLSYPEFVWLMDRSTLLLTDSGGIQEEAPSLGKPVLVMRATTERPEAIACGVAELVGTDRQRIIERVSAVLAVQLHGVRKPIAENPYGDGQAAERIVDLIARRAWGA